MDQIKEIMEVFSPENANEMLGEGWILVAVVAGERYEYGDKKIGPIYVLGKK